MFGGGHKPNFRVGDDAAQFCFPDHRLQSAICLSRVVRIFPSKCWSYTSLLRHIRASTKERPLLTAKYTSIVQERGKVNMSVSSRP